MRMALLTAQKMGDEMMTEANKKRDELLEQAEADSKNRAEELRRELADEEARLTAAKSATRRFVEEARALVRDHEDFLSQLDEISAPEPREPGEDPEQKREEEIVDTARLIDSAVNKLVEEESGPYPAPEAPMPEAPAFGGEEDPDFRIHTPESKWSDEDEPTSPRPKFNFDDLRFGENYTAEE